MKTIYRCSFWVGLTQLGKDMVRYGIGEASHISPGAGFIKKSLAFAFILALAACGINSASSTPTQEITPTTPPPTETFTPSKTSSPTATETPVAPSAEFLAALNLNLDRSYEVIDNFYVDTYNNAKWAKLDNGVWVETTLEEKYGHLVPLNPDRPYLPTGAAVSDKGDNYHHYDPAYQVLLINPVWTGDVIKKQVTYQGATIEEEGGVFVLRDLSGKLVDFRIRFGSLEVPGSVTIGIETPLTRMDSETGDPVNIFHLGEQVGVWIYFEAPGNSSILSTCFPNGFCTDEYNAGMVRFREQRTAIQTFINALIKGEEVPEHSELVLIYDLMSVQR